MRVTDAEMLRAETGRSVTPKIKADDETATLAEIADAPVDVLYGVSKTAAWHLKEAFGVETVRDLGTNKYFLWAQAISTLAGAPSEGDDAARSELDAFVYVSADRTFGEQVAEAIRDWVSNWGMELVEHGEPRQGSWMQRFALRTRSLMGSQAAQEALQEMAEAARSYLAEEQHANVGKIHSESFKNVMEALDGGHEAVIILGELVVVKYDGKVRARTVTAVLARQIQETPGMCDSPERLVHLLWPSASPRDGSEISEQEPPRLHG